MSEQDIPTHGLPVVRLKPKAEARAIRHGFPWVYADELVTDRRTQGLVPGALAVLEDGERRPMGLVTVNPKSKIIARMLDRDPAAEITQDWFSDRLSRALAHRTRLYPQPFYRLVHAEADGLPGVVIDRFGDVAVVQPNAAWAEAHLEVLVSALVTVTGVKTVIKNGSGRARGLEGLDEEVAVVHGAAIEGPLPVPMNGAIYMADLIGGQKTGLFFDQRENHAFAARLARGARVLDIFSHVGGFALAALAGGAASAVAVDASAAALTLAGQGAKVSGFADRFATRQGDAFEVLEALGAESARFDLVICDPPAFAPAKPALEAGLRAYERIARLAAPLVAPGGYLVLCSCSHAADLQAFRNASARGIGRGWAPGQIIHTGFAGPDHPVLPQLAESSYSESAGLSAGWMKAVLDACVLYPTVLREILQGAGEAGLFQPVFSDRILREWVLATAKLGPEAPVIAEGEALSLRAAFPRALERAHPEIEARLILPDPNDRHVLASAIASGADAIVTFNAQDFPGHVLAAEGIARRDPDGFLWELQSGQPDKMARIVEAVRAKAEAISGQPVALKALLKRARLYRLAKAMGV